MLQANKNSSVTDEVQKQVRWCFSCVRVECLAYQHQPCSPVSADDPSLYRQRVSVQSPAATRRTWATTAETVSLKQPQQENPVKDSATIILLLILRVYMWKTACKYKH